MEAETIQVLTGYLIRERSTHEWTSKDDIFLRYASMSWSDDNNKSRWPLDQEADFSWVSTTAWSSR
jgi:hypothetical protein